MIIKYLLPSLVDGFGIPNNKKKLISSYLITKYLLPSLVDDFGTPNNKK